LADVKPNDPGAAALHAATVLATMFGVFVGALRAKNVLSGVEADNLFDLANSALPPEAAAIGAQLIGAARGAADHVTGEPTTLRADRAERRDRLNAARPTDPDETAAA
jgi:hypothetical protein